MLKQKAVSGIKWTTASVAGKSVVQLAQFAVLTRLLGPADFGQIAIIMTIVGLSQAFVDAGLSNAIVYRREIPGAALSSLYWVNVIAGFAIALLLIGAAPFIASFYRNPGLASLTRHAAIAFFFIPFGQQYWALLQKQLRFGALATTELVSSSVGLIVSVVLALRHAGARAYVDGTVAAAFVSSCLLVAAGVRIHRPALRINLADLRGFIGFGLFQMGERSLNYLGSNLDKLLIGRFFGMELLGYYNLAYQVMMRPLGVINTVVSRVAFPVYATMQGTLEVLNRVFINNVGRVTFVSFPVYGALFIAADPVITLLFGKGYHACAPILQLLCVLGAVWSIGNPLGSFLLALGKANIGFFMTVAQVAVTVVALVAGSRGPFMVFVGLYVGLYIVCMVPLDYAVRFRVSRMSVSRHVASYAVSGCIVCLLCALTSLTRTLIPGEGLVRAGLEILTGAAAYLGLSWRFNKPTVRLFR